MENTPKLTLVENSQNILTRLYAEWKKAHEKTMKQTEENIRRAVNWRECA